MATFTPVQIPLKAEVTPTFATVQTQQRFIYRHKMSSLSAGQEGKELRERSSKVSDSIQNLESVQRLLQALEDEHKKRQQKLESYISSLRYEAESTLECEFTVFVIDYSLQVWRELSRRFSEGGLCLEAPDACPGQSDNFMYTWSKAEHYLECEIFGHGAVEFFYRNRRSGEVWGEDTTLEHGFSTDVLEKATFFAW
jgi:hypothetical protein